MSDRVRVPRGYRRMDRAGTTVLLRDDLADADAGVLSEPGNWRRTEGAAGDGSGRGATARLALPGGGGAVLKRMRRGGILAGLWRDRFVGTRRLLANLAVPEEAIRRGVPTPVALALRLREGPPGLYQAWLAVREIEGSEDLRARLSRRPAPGDTEMTSVLSVIRALHDAGVDHPDLNLGNVLLRHGTAGVEAWVLDLDRASVAATPVPARRRARALLRLERSYLKEFGSRGPLGPAPLAAWLPMYVAGDAALEDALREAGTGRTRRRTARRWWWRLRREGRAGRPHG